MGKIGRFRGGLCCAGSGGHGVAVVGSRCARARPRPRQLRTGHRAGWPSSPCPTACTCPTGRPAAEGPLGDLPPILAPLDPPEGEPDRAHGLTLDGGRPHADGPGDHARAAASFLTGAHPYKTDGKDIRNGVSVDQAAPRRRSATRPGSPRSNWACEPSAQAGNCDSGYSCVYTSNISWRTPTSPMTQGDQPAGRVRPAVRPDERDRDGPAGAAQRDRDRKSMLDFVAEDAAARRHKLGRSDRRKLDEYLLRRARDRTADRPVGQDAAAAIRDVPAVARPEGTPKGVRRARAADDGHDRAGLPDRLHADRHLHVHQRGRQPQLPRDRRAARGHHELSHHGDDPEKQAQISKINRYHIGLLGALPRQAAGRGRKGERTLLRPVHDHVRQRPQRRRPPQPRRPADPPGRPRRRHDPSRAATSAIPTKPR